MAIFLGDDEVNGDIFGGGQVPEPGAQLAGVRPRKVKDPAEEQRRLDRASEIARQRMQQRQFQQGAAQPMIPFIGPGQQYMQAQSMANNTMDAIQNENDSRVAQVREANRMEHEKELERMRQETILRKLEIEREQAEKDRLMQQKAMFNQGLLKQVIHGGADGVYTTYE